MKFDVSCMVQYVAEIEADSYEAVESLIQDMDAEDWNNYFREFNTEYEISEGVE